MVFKTGFSTNFIGATPNAIPNCYSISVSSTSTSTSLWGITKQIPSPYQHRKGVIVGSARISIIPGFNVLFLLAILILLMTIVPFIGMHMLASPSDNFTSIKETSTNDTNVNVTSTLRNITLYESGSMEHVSNTEATSAVPITTQDSPTSSTGQPSGLDASLPFIHIVNTRFQQHVHNLTALGAARLQLFETFCLPSIIHQTSNQNNDTDYHRFLWIIKVDPMLDTPTKKKMVDMLKPFPNFFLVGSNNNFGASYGKGIHRGSWRSGHAGRDVLYGNATATERRATTTSMRRIHRYNYTTSGSGREEKQGIYTGNVTLLHLAHSLRNDKIILETRLDADDGLPVTYLEDIQQSAIEQLSVSSDQKNRTAKKKWMYWCVADSLSWHPTVMVDEFKKSHVRPTSDDPGRFTMEYNSGKKYCLTPGLTSGISVGVQDSEVPRYSHMKLFSRLTESSHHGRNECCISGNDDLNNNQTQCIQLYRGKANAPIRARTPTSAGMSNVVLHSKAKLLQYNEAHIEAEYGILKERLIQANHYFFENLTKIVTDNLQGQCTKGHSCKSFAKKVLKAIIDISTYARRVG